MSDSIYKKYGIDPNRIHTDAEVKLFSYCFGVSEAEAAAILNGRNSSESKGLSPNMRETQNHVRKARTMSVKNLSGGTPR